MSGGGQPSADGGDGGAPPVIVTDQCPNDPAKTAPGVCGCGFPEADTAQLGSCKVLKNALVHRYDFEGTGTAVMDRVGTAHGVIKGAATLSQVSGKGAVVLSGGATGPYVDLPNGILSSLTSATLEAWVTWGGGGGWQRIFDFGDSTSATPEDNPLNGKSYLFLTPQTPSGSGGLMRAAYSLTGGATAAETRVEGTTALAQTRKQVVVVVDAAAGKLLLYVDGAKTGEQTFAGSLRSINDVNVWLGRSQYDGDPELTGTFHDFRIYSAALPALQIATSFAGGPDPAFL
jgi:Concanavalin A-like lectin/glucanases superfamily